MALFLNISALSEAPFHLSVEALTKTLLPSFQEYISLLSQLAFPIHCAHFRWRLSSQTCFLYKLYGFSRVS